jgi:epsilon-lactone hydrolase
MPTLETCLQLRLQRRCAPLPRLEHRIKKRKDSLMRIAPLLLLACTALIVRRIAAQSDNAALAPLQVPARTVPVPTDVSPELQRLIAAPRRPGWDKLWKTGEEWRAEANAQAAKTLATLPAMRERLHVTVKPTTIDGVRAFIVTPDVIPPSHRDKLLIHVHGGCYVLSPGEAGTSEAILMAGLGHFKVISVDYRMPPEAYFPAALDDAMTVYKAALKTSAPNNTAVFGTSAGGALVLEMMLRAKQLGIPLPGAIAPGTPMSDVTKTGDSFYTNELVDNVLVSRNGFCDAATVVYAHGHDLSDPLLSPVYGDMHGFPPAILTTGTRDLLLSNTVRVHRKLRQAGVDAQLEVFEGMSHAQYQFDDRVPETREAFGEITAFFDKHLGH